MLRTLIIAMVSLIIAGPASAASGECLPMAGLEPRVVPAALAADEVQLTFLGHATFLIESAGGVTIATDYTGERPRDRTPDVVTMNRAHPSHYTSNPDPAIRHVLRGWSPDGSAGAA